MPMLKHTSLRKRNDELTDKVADLERRIERFEMQDVIKAKAGIIIHGIKEQDDETDPTLLERLRNTLGKQLNVATCGTLCYDVRYKAPTKQYQ